MHFHLKTAFLRVFFSQKLQRQKSVANPQENNVNTLRPKKYLHLSGVANFCDCNSIRQTIYFYRKYRNFMSIFHAKTAEKKRSLEDPDGRNFQNSWKVISTFVQDGQLF